MRLEAPAVWGVPADASPNTRGRGCKTNTLQKSKAWKIPGSATQCYEQPVLAQAWEGDVHKCRPTKTAVLSRPDGTFANLTFCLKKAGTEVRFPLRHFMSVVVCCTS